MNIILVTTYPLTNIRTRQTGVHQRLKVLLEAACEASNLVTLVSLGHTVKTKRLHEFEQVLATELAVFWSVNVKVRCVLVNPNRISNFSWKYHLARILRTRLFTRLESVYDLVTTDFYDVMHGLIDRQTVVIAHRLPAMSAVRRVLSPAVPIVFDLDDIEHERQQQYLQFYSRFVDRLQVRLAQFTAWREEKAAIRRAEATLVCSWKDVDKLHLMFRKARPVYAPNSVHSPITAVPPITASDVMLMVANYNGFFNSEGARWFVREVWPRVLSYKPNAQLWFVGDNGGVIFDYQKPPDNVRVFGFLEHLQSAYAGAQVVICPVRAGSGTRIKILEAMAYERPVVTTTIGVEGLEFEHNVHVLVGDSAESFAMHCVQLLSNTTNCRQIAVRARRKVRLLYDHDTVMDRLIKKLKTIRYERRV
jgi:glycosyltransferase involved in cell wall biosynthesis